MKTTIILLTLSFLAVGCASKSKPAPPEFASVVRRATAVSDSLGRARSDNKEVKAIHVDSLSLLDEVEAKINELLK
jgi:hypothetical protein